MSWNPTELRKLHRALELPRAIEDRMLRLIRQNRLSKWFSGYGQEAIAVGCVWGANDRDVILPLHRNLGVWTTRNVPLHPLLCQVMGKAGGYTNGRDRTFHFGLPDHRIVGMISHLGAMLPVACGIAQAAQLRREDYVAIPFCGDGATREGDFHESLSLASLWKLPVVFVVENNGYGLSTPTSEAVPIKDIASAASGYGMPGEVVDGNDLLAVIAAIRRSVQRARSGGGPTLLEMKTFRRRGHEEASGTKYVPKALMEEWAAKDPVDRFASYLVKEGVMEREEVHAVREEVSREVSAAAEFALAQPVVTSTTGKERKAVFAASPPAMPPPTESSRRIRYIDAISEGLEQAMEEDDRVILMGQDVAEYGGVFKVSQGLREKFGALRVRNTPIIESGAIGAAMGLALEGLCPVVEMQYADFISCGFNQIVNNLATTHYRWGAPLNVTIRAPYGGSIGAGPFHSQSKEAWFCHVPGLKVVVPATTHDAKGLLLASITDPNPVLFFEHKYLYRSERGLVPEASYTLPIGEATIARAGTHATIVTYGLGRRWAMEECEHLREVKGAEVEVIDLRSLVPWDWQTVKNSVQKTGKVLILHEATATCGFGAEVAATICERAFEYLDAPPLRVAAEDLPVPASRSLEKSVFSARRNLRSALQVLLDY